MLAAELTEEQRRGRLGSDVPGGLQAGSCTAVRFFFSTSEFTESRLTLAVLRGWRSCCTAEWKQQGRARWRGYLERERQSLEERVQVHRVQVTFISHNSKVHLPVFRDGYGFCSLTLSVHASLQTSLQSTSLTLVPMSLVNHTCSSTRLTPETRTTPSRHMYHLKTNYRKPESSTQKCKKGIASPPHL